MKKPKTAKKTEAPKSTSKLTPPKKTESLSATQQDDYTLEADLAYDVLIFEQVSGSAVADALITIIGHSEPAWKALHDTNPGKSDAELENMIRRLFVSEQPV